MEGCLKFLFLLLRSELESHGKEDKEEAKERARSRHADGPRTFHANLAIAVA